VETATTSASIKSFTQADDSTCRHFRLSHSTPLPRTVETASLGDLFFFFDGDSNSQTEGISVRHRMGSESGGDLRLRRYSGRAPATIG
jgi:hypothetical protein